MSIWTYLLFTVILLLSGAYIVFYFFIRKIYNFERKLILLFSSRNDTIPGLYEISKNIITRHEEIFGEILTLRKKEFALLFSLPRFNTFLELEKYIHHEINFIFQVCNKNQQLIKNKNFLYIRDVIIDKSSLIGVEMKKYEKIIEIYNKTITIKNYSIVGLLLPFSKKHSSIK